MNCPYCFVWSQVHNVVSERRPGDDASGLTTGVAQKLEEATATVEVKAADTSLWRIEYRGDISNRAVFLKDNIVTLKRQQSIAFALLYAFSGKIH